MLLPLVIVISPPRYIIFDERSHFPAVTDAASAPLVMGVLGDALTPLGSGGTRTTRQTVAELIQGDGDLRRVAQVVAWLESLARRDVRRGGENGVGPLAAGSYVLGDGLWRETSLAMRDPGQTALVRALDPDAPSREDRHLGEDDRASEERLLGDVFRLLRAGMFEEAAGVLRAAGQPFRAAVITGCGPTGPTPVGHALRALLLSPEAQRCQEEALVGDVEGGAASGRFAWRAACKEAAERLGTEAAETPAASYESAILGLLSGHVDRLLPLCDSWEDVCWAVFRCWLEVQVDDRMRRLVGSPPEAPVWPDRELVAACPRSFVEALGRVEQLSAGPRKREGAAGVYRRLQELLILRHVAPRPQSSAESLVAVLHAETMRAAQRAREIATEEPDMHVASSGSLVPWGLLRFASHCLPLTQRSLGPTTVPPSILAAVLSAYAAHLTESGKYALAPRYLAQLPEGPQRTMNFVSLIEHVGLELSAEGGAARELFDACRVQLEAFPLPASSVMDVLRLLARKSHESLINGPLRKIRALYWLAMELERRMELEQRTKSMNRDRSSEVATFALEHLCRVARDLSVSVQGAVTSPVEQATRERMFTGPGSVFHLLQQSQATVPAAIAQEAEQWALYFRYTEVLAHWAVLSARAAGTLPSEGRWAAVSPEDKGHLTSACSNALLLADAVLEGGWLSQGGPLPQEERLAVSAVVVPCSSGRPAEADAAPGEHPSVPLVDVEYGPEVVAKMSALLRGTFGDRYLEVAVKPFQDDDAPGSTAFQVDLRAPGPGEDGMALLSDALQVLLEPQEDVYRMGLRARHHVFFLASTPEAIAKELARRRLVRDVLGSAARIRAQLAALEYDVEGLAGQGAFVLAAATGPHYAILAGADAMDLMEAERKASISYSSIGL